ncbi:BAG family molecular chaperone regulator 2-like [Abrus precatorius]|uniref:BAG family molecular chaperone regulator 2-like n=1 Tax=Abrus precatorius TaxID=3816 RepID=A0A8B8KYU7_ABRPR|nr:BAG family molecular chaperone regulator 2-like [Abrus precatorius]
MIKLRSMRFSRSSSKLGNGNKAAPPSDKDCRNVGDIQWELRPGGMLVQKRDRNRSAGEGMITVTVSTVSQSHEISIEATSTFGELKMILSLVTSLEPREQRLLFKGKEKDDDEYLHMAGVRDKDKVLLLEDPAIKEMKQLGLREQTINNPFCTIRV